ncbi:MAG: hypothetical protein Fur002_24840 [Anaerolineales bacterium]
MKLSFRFILLPAVLSLFTLAAVLPRQNASVVFAVIGDYGSGSAAEADVARLVKSWNPDFIVTVGDNNYPDGASYSIDQNIGQYFHSYIYKYKGKYGGGSETQRFFPSLGNHDWHNGSANPHLNYFTLPGNERYYDFTYSAVNFFVLDSVSEDGNAPDSAQAKWLKEKMSASTLPFQIVVMHYPPYSSGKHGAVTFMQWDFKAWGADAVLSGHDHDYERLQANGLTYFVNGLGGSDLGNFRESVLPESQLRYNMNYGAMRVEANNAYIKFQFINRDNLLIDEYVIGNAPAASQPPTSTPALAPTETPAPTYTPVETPSATPTATLEIFPTSTPTATLPPPTLTAAPSATAFVEVVSAPILLSPPNHATVSAHYLFAWQSIYNASRYHIEIDNNADFSSPEWSSWRKDATYAVSSMPRKTAYYWRVRAKTMTSDWGAWSQTFNLNVP